MIGKFRKRPQSVRCPKPVMMKKWVKAERGFTSIISKSTRKVTMKDCEICDYLEEFGLDNNGIFCLYGVDCKRESKTVT